MTDVDIEPVLRCRLGERAEAVRLDFTAADVIGEVHVVRELPASRSAVASWMVAVAAAVALLFGAAVLLRDDAPSPVQAGGDRALAPELLGAGSTVFFVDGVGRVEVGPPRAGVVDVDPTFRDATCVSTELYRLCYGPHLGPSGKGFRISALLGGSLSAGEAEEWRFAVMYSDPGPGGVIAVYTWDDDAVAVELEIDGLVSVVELTEGVAVFSNESHEGSVRLSTLDEQGRSLRSHGFEVVPAPSTEDELIAPQGDD